MSSDLNQPPSQSSMATAGWRFWVALALVTALGFILRLWKLGEPGLWTDEVFTEFRAQAPLADSLQSMWAAGNQNPLYYFLLRPLPTHTEFLLRLPSALLGGGSVLLMGVCAWRLTGDRWLAIWAGILLAISPFHIMLSRNARAYPLMFVVSLLTLYLFLELLRGRRSRTMWVGFTLSSMAAYTTHYSGGVLGLAQLVMLALVARADRPFLRRWFGAQVIAALPFAIWLVLLALNFESTYQSGFDSPTLLNVPVSLWNLLIGYDGDFAPVLLPGLVAVMALLLAGTLDSVRQYRTRPIGVYSVLLIWLSIIPVTLLAITITPAYQDRYFTVFLPALILLLLIGARHLPHPAGVVLLALVALTAAYNTFTLFDDGSYQRADWKGVNAHVVANYQQGDGLLLERDHPLMVFERYFSGDPAWLEGAVLLRDQPDTSALEASTERIWVIYRNPLESFHRQGAMPAFDPFDAELNIVGAWLSLHEDRVVDIQTFQGVTVVLVADQPGNEKDGP